MTEKTKRVLVYGPIGSDLATLYSKADLVGLTADDEQQMRSLQAELPPGIRVVPQSFDAPAIAEPAAKVKLTKKALSTFMQWSSSPANECTKAEAVDVAYRVLMGTYQPHGAKQPILEYVFITGGFAAKGRLASRKYLVDFATQTIAQLGEADKVMAQLVFESRAG